MLSTLCPQGTAKQNYKEISPHSCKTGYIKQLMTTGSGLQRRLRGTSAWGAILTPRVWNLRSHELNISLPIWLKFWINFFKDMLLYFSILPAHFCPILYTNTHFLCWKCVFVLPNLVYHQLMLADSVVEKLKTSMCKDSSWWGKCKGDNHSPDSPGVYNPEGGIVTTHTMWCLS